MDMQRDLMFDPTYVHWKTELALIGVRLYLSMEGVFFIDKRYPEQFLPFDFSLKPSKARVIAAIEQMANVYLRIHNDMQKTK
jgi:hypothetical protein